jgi:hypothetical protein
MTKERFAEIMRKGTIEDALKECWQEGFYAGVSSEVRSQKRRQEEHSRQSVLSKLLRLQG